MLGMPSLLELVSLEEQFKCASELGLDFIELNLNMPGLMDVQKVNYLKEKYKLKVSIHAHEDMNPFYLETSLRMGAIELFHKTMKFAEAVAAIGVTMHLSKGIRFTLPQGKVYLNKVYYETYIQYLHEFKSIMTYKTPLNVENTGILDMPFIYDAVEILIGHKNIFLTYDVGHDFKSGYKDLDFYKKHKTQVKHIHLHDVLKGKDHLELFTGEIDIKKILNYQLPTVIEVKTQSHLQKSIETLKKRGLF